MYGLEKYKEIVADAMVAYWEINGIDPEILSRDEREAMILHFTAGMTYMIHLAEEEPDEYLKFKEIINQPLPDGGK